MIAPPLTGLLAFVLVLFPLSIQGLPSGATAERAPQSQRPPDPRDPSDPRTPSGSLPAAGAPAEAPTPGGQPQSGDDRQAVAVSRVASGGVAFRNAQSGDVTLYNYGVYLTADSAAIMDITDLGELPGGSLGDAASAATMPATPRGRIRLPLLALRQLLSTAESHEAVPKAAPRVGVEVGMENGRVVLGLRRSIGIPVALTLAVLGLLLALVVYLLRQNRQTRRAFEVLEQGQRAAVASREAERLRIAREIHDGPVQRLAALALTMGSNLQSPTAAEDLRELTRELRGMADGLRPPSLERFGLGAAIEALAMRVEEENPDMTVLAQVDEQIKSARVLSKEDEVNLYRIAQEAVNNAVEHSAPTLLVVRLSGEASLSLEVIDDGSGFEWPADLSALREAGHFGLVGITERAELLSAEVSVTEGRAGGTHIKVVVPKSRVRLPATA